MAASSVKVQNSANFTQLGAIRTSSVKRPSCHQYKKITDNYRPRKNVRKLSFRCTASSDEDLAGRVEGAQSWIDGWRAKQDSVGSRVQSAQTWIDNWRGRQNCPESRVLSAQSWIDNWRAKQDGASAAALKPAEEGKQENKKESWWRKYAKFDKNTLASMGASCALSYGFISNANYISYLIISVFLAMKQTGMSPLLSQEAFKVFAGLYAVDTPKSMFPPWPPGFFLLGNVLRPLRIALAVTISPFFDKLVKSLESTFKLKKKVYAFAMAVFLVNVCGSISYLVGGLAVASWYTGVPVGWVKLTAFFKAAKAAKAAAAVSA
ncbi:hypothetical protein CYMTET_35550 [Cymbomonas tetramitiformis]|uniref:Uncharacterized protein n=1 Tax=Cymbomonas tetramitiformis TaxID=36881 RepID=A0AAE0KNQ9_9CHLO|nr:hypothetical protein CYMTET_35550 [Cymbomonas tetramitiformis]